ncbi:DUF7524 family protein [Halobaculum rubrum]|uniref:DUF7524 family protein n=1 Tax=Halobaculum rubrum TaxID=2872158 RepID=UPI001CA3F2D7|nr:hypothetical protein [Halobaculum rubrum]QZX98629.1 hypothetical protein K6T25_10105 [Halobaculum rubrum]
MSSEAAILGVTLNRDRLNGVTAPESFATDGEFAVELENEGEPVHVHLRFDGPVAEVASVTPPNHYVDGGATRTVRVSVAPVNAAVEGVLEIVVGHGAERTTVPLRIAPSSNAAGDDSAEGGDPADGDPAGDLAERDQSGDPSTAAADPSASTPTDDGRSVSASTARQRLVEGIERSRVAAGAVIESEVEAPSPTSGTLAVGALAAAALVGAGIVAVALDGFAVTLGVVAVCVAVLVAGFLLFG